MNWMLWILLLCGLMNAGHAQEARKEFEVVSVKATPSDARGFSFAALPGGRLIVRNNPLRNILINAFDVRNFQLIGLPAWWDSDRFDIEARAPGNPTREEMMQMLQLLLADRFKLKGHRETKELPVFVLGPAKGGIKLQAWAEGSCTVVEPGQPAPRATAGRGVPRTCGNNIVSPKGQNMEWTAYRIDMPRLIMVLSSIMGNRVVDNTGYTGTFDLHLEWARSDAPSTDADGAGLSIFAALQQLGLKLESGRGPVEMLVIDHVERPTEN
jgi:uncharacterized protein (TIGR03435 family)